MIMKRNTVCVIGSAVLAPFMAGVLIIICIAIIAVLVCLLCEPGNAPASPAVKIAIIIAFAMWLIAFTIEAYRFLYRHCSAVGKE